MTILEMKLEVNLRKQHELLKQYHDAQEQYKNFDLNKEQFDMIADSIFNELRRLAEQQEILEQFEQDDEQVFNTKDLPF